MAVVAERVTINPAVEDPTLRPLDLAGLDRSWGVYLLEHDYPPPDLEVLHSSSADTEGDPVVSSRYLNRTITARVRVFEPEDGAGENKIPNPDFEANTTGWSLNAPSWTAATFTREQLPTAMLVPGSDYGVHLKGTKDATVTERTLDLETLSEKNGMPVVAGTTYTLSAYVYGTKFPTNSLGNSVGVRIFWFNGEGVFLSSFQSYGTATPTGVMTRLTVTKEAPAGAAFALAQIIARSNTTSDTFDFWVDRVQFEANASATAFIDGDVPGCDWTGARHASASTRPAPDGTRFSRICRDVTRILDGIKTRRSGVLRRISALGGPLYYDLRTAKMTDAPQNIGIGMKRAEYGLAFEALPGGRGTEIQIGGNFDETTKPALSFLAENVPGELPALGRLVVEDRQGQNQLAAWWGLQRDTYSSSADAELFYEAETRKTVGSSAVEALAGASGAEGKAVKSGALVPAWQSVISTQAASGNHLAHTGTYRLLVRVYRPASNTGKVSIKLQWTEGDFVNTTFNDLDEQTWAANEAEGKFQVVDLGVVTLNQAPAGSAQRWEGRILAKSTAKGDVVYVDCLMLQPITEASGKAEASLALPPSDVLGAYDAFNQGSGALAGKTAEVGGAWSGAGDTDDFSILATVATRTALSDVSGTPRYEILGTNVFTNIAVNLLFGTNNKPWEGEQLYMGCFARYVDVNNWVALLVTREQSEVWPGTNANHYYAGLYKKVAGVRSFVSGSEIDLGTVATGVEVAGALQLIVLANGEWRVGAQRSVFTAPISRIGIDAAFNSATGTLKEGKIGLFDEKKSGTAETRSYDAFEAYVPSADAVLFASRQFEVRSNLARRQDVGGTTWGSPSYTGDYLLVPQAGPEKRPTRFFVKASRNPDSDDGIDDIRANLFVTPRYLLAPPT